MKLLMVTRPRIDDISVKCEVVIRGAIPTVVGSSFWADIVTIDNQVAKQLSIPASVIPVNFGIASTFKGYKGAWLQNATESSKPIHGGVFKAIVEAKLGDKLFKSSCEFIVNNDEIIIGR